MQRNTNSFLWHNSAQAKNARRSLRFHLLETNAPLGDLTSAGVDLDAAIVAETDFDLLLGALARARDNNDQSWQLKTAEKLLTIDAPEVILNGQIDMFIDVEYFSGAADHLRKASPATSGAFRFAVWSALISEGRGDLDTFEIYLGILKEHHPDAVSTGFLNVAKALTKRGAYGLALEFLDKADAIALPENRHALGAQRLATLLVQDGPERAQLALEGMRSAFPKGAAVTLEQHALIHLHRGKYLDALESLADALASAPHQTSLYSLLQNVAFSADSRAHLDTAVEKLARSHPTSLTVLLHRFERLSGRKDSRAETNALLKQIRRQSEWHFRVSQMTLAFHTQDFEAHLEAEAQAKFAYVPARWRAMMVVNYAYFAGHRPWTTTEMRKRLKPFEQRSFHNPNEVATILRTLIADGDVDAAQTMFESCATGLKSHVAVAPFKMFFEAQARNHTAAKAGWTRHLRATGNPPVSAKTAPPEAVTLTYTPKPGAILLFCVVHNGIQFVEWFLEHYRKLGVDHFFFVDNGSDDGTFETLRAQSDVSLHFQGDSFSNAKCGIVWINHLIQRFGCDHWCLHVDIDEALVFDGVERGRSLRDLIASMEAEGAETYPAFMLDIYPERTNQTGDENPFESSCYIDDDYVCLPHELPPYRFVKGGIRGRTSGQNLLMTKAPLVKVHRNFCYTLNNHHHTHLPPSKEQGVVLHYKFVGDISKRVDEAIARGEHYLGARFYQLLKAPLERGLLKDKDSILYTGIAQLRELGYVVGPQPSGWKKEVEESLVRSGVAK